MSLTLFNTVSATDLTADELQELQNAIKEDEQMKKLLMVIRQGWPQQKSSCDPMLAPYWDFRDELSLCDDVVLKGLSLVIPRKLRAKYMRLTHNAHMGADACLRRARGSICWPRMTSDLRAMVEKCETCARYAPHQQREPLCQPKTPDRAWSSVSADIITHEGKDYLVTIDALNGYFEIDRLRQQTVEEVILKLKMHFARYGAPLNVITDNARPFTSDKFQQFACRWRFEHRTSSPHYPRSNGQAEAAVKVAKTLIGEVQRERGDIYKALLDYRNTPRSTTGLSPEEVLMQRKTRTATLS